MFQQAKNSGADIMVTTEKDAVRIPDSISQSYLCIMLEIEIIEGFEDFQRRFLKDLFPDQKENQA